MLQLQNPVNASRLLLFLTELNNTQEKNAVNGFAKHSVYSILHHCKIWGKKIGVCCLGVHERNANADIVTVG